MVKELSMSTAQAVKTQQSTQNNTTSNDDQKYGRKRLGRRNGTIPLPSRSWHKKNNKEPWKNKIKNNKQCSIIYNKTCLNIYIYIYIYA